VSDGESVQKLDWDSVVNNAGKMVYCFLVSVSSCCCVAEAMPLALSGIQRQH
jgi:hypothetical protein